MTQKFLLFACLRSYYLDLAIAEPCKGESVNLEIRDVRVVELIEYDADLVQVATGFQFTEGPIWHPQQQMLIFSDIIGDAMFQWTYEDGVFLFRSPSHCANGICL